VPARALTPELDQWHLATRVRETEREALALAAVERAATELGAELRDVVVLAFDYEGEDEALDRVLASDAPLRALL
jgi:predicted Zn-dependent protease with MMP-like domain